MFLIRRLRAALTVGLLWGIGWAISGTLLAAWSLFRTLPVDYWRLLLSPATFFGAAGLAAGLVFAAGLRRRTEATSVDALPVGVSVRWGAVAGAASMLVLRVLGLTIPVPLLVAGVIMSAVGAASALTTIKLARRATPLNAMPRVDSLNS